MNRKTGRKVIDVAQYSNQIIAIKLNINPVDTFILQVYISTSTHKDDEIEEIY